MRILGWIYVIFKLTSVLDTGNDTWLTLADLLKVRKYPTV
jgi:hypothetical protein